MTAIILTIQAMIVLALIGVVLLQRSDGAGGLGMGGGGGGVMSGRGAANALTRTTSVLAAAFFANSLIFSLVVGTDDDQGEFLPINEEGELSEDDFSDFLTEDTDDAPAGDQPRPQDAFELPEDLGTGTEAPAADPAAEPEDAPNAPEEEGEEPR